MARASYLCSLLTFSLLAQLLPCSTMSNTLSHSHYSLEHSYQGPDGRIRTSNAPPDRMRESCPGISQVAGLDRHSVRGEAIGSGADTDLAFVGAMPLTGAFPAAPALSGMTAGPGPSSVGAGQGWVWAVGADGPQLVRGNGTALSAYSLYGPSLPLKSQRGGPDAMAWTGAAGQPAAPGMLKSVGKSWGVEGRGEGAGAGLRAEQLKVPRLFSPSLSTPSTLRGEMVAKLRGLSGRFEVARGPPVNLLLRPPVPQQPQPSAAQSEQTEAAMEESDEGVADPQEAGRAWHAAGARERVLELPTSDSWLEDHNQEDRALLPHVASLLACAAEGGDEEAQGAERSAFDAQRRPKVSLGDYCQRIVKYGACSAGCLALALLYMDRFLARAPHLRVSGLNVHRLLLSAVLLATKQWDDSHYNNAFWAKVGGVGNEELNWLEQQLLAGLRWKLHVDKPEFDAYRAALLRWPTTPEAADALLQSGAVRVEGMRGRGLAEGALRGLRASKGKAAAVALKRDQPPVPPAPAAAAAAPAPSPAIAA